METFTKEEMCHGSYMCTFIGKHSYIKNKTLLYLRYIDDLFFISKGTEVEILEFFETINKIHPYIKFDFEYSYDKIVFLDTAIYKIKKHS